MLVLRLLERQLLHARLEWAGYALLRLLHACRRVECWRVRVWVRACRLRLLAGRAEYVLRRLLGAHWLLRLLVGWDGS